MSLVEKIVTKVKIRFSEKGIMMLLRKFLTNMVFIMAVMPSLFSLDPSSSTMSSDSIREYAIAVLLPPEAAKKAAEMNKQIAAQLPTFANPHNNWHVTLYHLACNKEAISEIVSKLRELKVEPFKLSFTGLYATADRWVDWGMTNTEPLGALHKTVVEIASKHHKRPLKRASDIYNTLPAEKRAQVDAYGVSGVLEFYNPHTTLFYYEFEKNGLKGDMALQAVSKKLTEMNGMAEVTCDASVIVVGELGYNGNITKILYEIPLSGAAHYINS